MPDDKIVDFIFSMPDTCVLDIADRHEWDGCTLEEVAGYVGVTRERIRQILDGVTHNNKRQKDGALQLFRKRFKRMYPKAAEEIWSILEDINIRMELADGSSD